jgi:hypothetical protein
MFETRQAHKLLAWWTACLLVGGLAAAIAEPSNSTKVATGGDDRWRSSAVDTTETMRPLSPGAPTSTSLPLPEVTVTVPPVTLPPLPDVTVPSLPNLGAEEPDLATQQCREASARTTVTSPLRERGMFIGSGPSLTRIATTGDPGAWSPDGSTVAFHLPGGVHCAMDADGTDARVILRESLSNGPRMADGWLEWTADGRSVAGLIQHQGSSANRLELLDPRGGAPRVIDLPDGPHSVDVSPTRNEVVLGGWGPGGEGTSAVYVVQLSNGAARRLATSSWADVVPRWSPDGQRLAWQTGGDLFVMDRDGSDQHVVWRHVDGQSVAGRFAWSPDSASLVLSTSWNGAPRGVLVVRADGTGHREIASEGAYAALIWSRDGWIVGARPAGSGRELFRMRPDGSSVHVIASAPAVSGRDHYFWVNHDWTMATPRFGLYDFNSPID